MPGSMDAIPEGGDETLSLAQEASRLDDKIRGLQDYGSEYSDEFYKELAATDEGAALLEEFVALQKQEEGGEALEGTERTRRGELVVEIDTLLTEYADNKNYAQFAPQGDLPTVASFRTGESYSNLLDQFANMAGENASDAWTYIAKQNDLDPQFHSYSNLKNSFNRIEDPSNLDGSMLKARQILDGLFIEGRFGSASNIEGVEMTAEGQIDNGVLRISEQITGMDDVVWTAVIHDYFDVNTEDPTKMIQAQSVLQEFPNAESYLNYMEGKGYVELSTGNGGNAQQVFEALQTARRQQRAAQKPKAGIDPTIAAAAGTSDLPAVEDAPPPSGTDTPPVEGAEAPNDLATDKGPETAELSYDQMREAFLAKRKDLMKWDGEDSFTVSGMNANDVKVSRIQDFIGPDAAVSAKTVNTDEVKLKSGDETYAWNADLGSWIKEDGTSMDDRLKVREGTTIHLEKKAAATPDAPPAEPTTPEPTEPTVPEAAPAEPEGMPDAPSKPTAKETRENEDKLAQGKEFSENLLNAEAKMAEFEKQFDKVNRLDTKDVDEGNADRYQRELGELKEMRDAAGTMLTDLGAEFAGLQENGVFPEGTPSTELRIARMDAMNTSFQHINHVIEDVLGDDKNTAEEEKHERKSPREARDQRLDAEWKDETMPHINGLVEAVDPNMSVDGEADVDTSGFRGNNKTLKLRYSTMNGENVTSVRRFDPEIKIRFRQVLPDDSYSAISSNFQVKYNGKHYQTIDAAVTKAAQDFKDLIDGPAVEPKPEAEPTPAPAEPTPEPVAPADAPAKVEGKAAETDKDGTTDDADLETAVATPGTVEATRKQTQAILKDVALLPTTTTNKEGRRVPLDSNESGFTGIIKSPSGEAHNYLQHVNKDGYVDQRYVQLEGEGDWLAIPYSNFIEQEKAKDYEGIEADDPDKKDRHQYRPTDDAVWKNRHKGGRMTLTKRSE